MRHLAIIFTILFSYQFLHAQYHDAIWKSSGYDDFHIHLNASLIKNYSSYLNLRQNSPPRDSIEISRFHGALWYSNLFSDSTGNPRFYTNGHTLWHAKGPKFVNGDSLQPTWNYYASTGLFQQNVVPGYFKVLPAPGKRDEYYLFALDEELPGARVGKKTFQYTQLKGVDSDSTGYVAEKNVVLLNRKFILPIDAIKHANGRDWWVLAFEDDSLPTKIELNTYLLDPNGVHFVQKQFVTGFEPSNLGTEYWHLLASPNGEKIVLNNARDFFVMHFDRCNGSVSNVRFQLHEYLLNRTPDFVISPNSRFLYIPTGGSLLQFDLEANDIEYSKVSVLTATQELILTTLGYFLQDSTRVLPERFIGCELASDGKIYFTGNNYTINSFISKPNEKGLACKPVRYGLKATCGLRGVQHPNFRLGPIDGTSCDSLGLDNKPLADFWWTVDPDSTGNKLFVEFLDNSSYEPATWKWRFNDNTGMTSADTNAVHTFPAAGTYNVCLEVCNQNACDTICKFVTVGQTSSIGEINTKLGYTLAYPNPVSREHVNIEYQLNTEPLDIEMWNANGILAASQLLPNEKESIIRLDITPLPTGLYFYRIRDKSGKFVTGKVVVRK